MLPPKSSAKSSEVSTLITLVEGAQAREPEAFLELLRRFAPLLSKWQRRLAEQMPHEEEEILHSEVRFAFLLLVLEFDAGRGVPFEGYVCRMMAHRLADQNKSRWRPVTLPFSEAALALGIEADNVVDCLHTSPLLSEVTTFLPDECWCRLWWQEATALLPPRQQQVICLVIEGYTEREIAEQIGVHHTTVSECKKKVRKKLQEMWQLHPCKTPEKIIYKL